MPIPETPTPDDATETQSSLQDGYSRFEETAHRLAGEAGPEVERQAERQAEAAEGYVHQGLDSLSKAGSAVAGAIRERPFVALAAAVLGGALLGASRRG